MKKRISTWQKFLSHLFELKLESVTTDQNNEVEVWLKDGRIKLTTRNAIYSYEDRYRSFVQAFRDLEEHLPKINNVLILGFGMGSIPWILFKNHGLTPAITGVDHDPLMARLYHQFYEADHVEVITADAADFIKTDTHHYDLICIDLFKDAMVPNKFEHPQFLESVKAHLHEGGWVLFNRLTMEQGLATATRTFYEHTFSEVFPDAVYSETVGNWILIGRKKPE